MSYKAFHNGKWIPFYPLQPATIYWGEREDSRPPTEVLSASEIYGKALINVLGFHPVWLYKTFPKNYVKFIET